MSRVPGARRRATVVAGLAVAATLGLAGCGSAGEQAARDADGEQACGLLAPDTERLLESLRPEGCQQALPSLDLPSDPVTDVQVWGDAAQARTAGGVLFLRDLQDGWRVVAAGCQPQGESRPYECVLAGP